MAGTAGGGIAYLQYLGTPAAWHKITAPVPAAAKLPAAKPSPARIAIVVSDFGDDQALSLLEARTLPPQISIAISPYGSHLQGAVAALRAKGHDLLLLLPMPGLIATAPTAQNLATLDWSLSQLQGYSGVTDAYGPAMGGGFMDNQSAKAWLLSSLARNNLYFIDGRNADMVMDGAAPDDPVPQLAQLVTDAEEQHTALGVLVDPAPATVTALAAWSKALARQNVVLVPASALVQPPENSPATQASISP